MSMASMMMSTLLASASSAPSLTSKTSYSSRNAKRRATTCQRQWRLGSLSIRSSDDENSEESPPNRMDRRNILIGGGVYETTLGRIHDQREDEEQDGQANHAQPIGPPDLSKCNSCVDGDALYPCCPPYAFGVLSPKPEEIPDYQIPSFTTLRQRKPVSKMSVKEVIKLVLAISKMKDLGEADPWNFVQQANIHCAFCNGAYNQVGFDNVPLQVHCSSIFLPWHRWYIYFFERILGKLMDDESFALPYWDYDHGDGMVFPEIYDVPPLLDEKRDHHARAGQQVENYVDLRYGCTPPVSIDELVERNLCYLKTIFKEGANEPKLFIGETPVAGQRSTVSGSLEQLHNAVHNWAGKPESPHFDMGNFITAARDPLFYAHHMNVDRLWEIFRTQFMNPTTDFETNNPHWLEASFIFYDENRRVVKVKVKDALNIENLGYSYHDMSVQWNDVECEPQLITTEARLEEFGSMPRALEKSPIRAFVKRPNSSRQKSEIEKTVEVVIVDGIEVVHTRSARFDVYINIVADVGYFAGSFITVSHGHEHGKTADRNAKKLTLKLGITTLVAELNAEAADSLVVTLVPRTGLFLIDGIHIEQNKIK